MRKAILDGLVPEFCNIPLPGMMGGAASIPQFPGHQGKQNYMMHHQNKVIFFCGLVQGFFLEGMVYFNVNAR